MAKEAQKKRNSRTALIDGQLMDTYRVHKGWDDLTLATKAGVSSKTIERARSGKPIQTATLAMIAEALGVLPVKLMPVQAVAEIIRPDPSAPQKPRMLACIVIDDESLIKEYIETGNVETLMMKWAYRGLLRDGIVNERVFDGSKIIVAEFSEDDFRRLSRFLSTNELPVDGIVHFGAISEAEPLEDQLARIREISSKRIAERHEAIRKAGAFPPKAKEITVQIGEDGKPLSDDPATDKLMKRFIDDENQKKNSGETKSG